MMPSGRRHFCSGRTSAADHHDDHAVIPAVVAVCYCHRKASLAWPVQAWLPVLTQPVLRSPAFALAEPGYGCRTVAAVWWIVRMMADWPGGGCPVAAVCGGHPVAVACSGCLRAFGPADCAVAPFFWIQALELSRQNRRGWQTDVSTGRVLRPWQPLYCVPVPVPVPVLVMVQVRARSV